DGNGTVDISDANLLINIVLGKESASKYNGRADVDGNGIVDVSDINAGLNIILGK
ncbi:dockerin type I domain-containing protein, partial [Sodaliphilus sp.]|uniref:dockerin type I domain-containing protein n=1 Tax=Sodaliphilus sp. TaxID=2815818 RepID=UPI00388E29C5